MKLKQKIVDDTVTITIEGNIIHEGIKPLRDFLKPLLEDSDIANFILDMKDVNTIDSSGVGFIVQTYKMLLREGKRFVLTSLSEKCNDVLTLTKLNKILTIVADNEAAMRVIAES